jgi:hypothetical protein
MTTEKAERIVRGGLLKTESQGIDRQAKEVVARLFLQLEMEAEEEREMGQVLHPGLDVKVIPPDSYIAPPPPPSQPGEAKSSLIILPDSAEARDPQKKTMGQAVTPLRLTRSGKTTTEDELTPKRSMESLMALLAGHQDIPPRLDVPQPGSERVIRLTRHIQAGEGFNAAKVTYVMDGMNQPRPSGNSLNGQGESDVQPMALDIPISEVFFTWEEDLKISERMARIRENAMKCYAPRPQAIVSNTPRRQGNLRFTEATPHEDV